MNDWMNELENELASMSPRSCTRDLKVAALCAHRDSQVLTAKRLRRELTAAEMDAAFEILEQKYPGLVVQEPGSESSIAFAIVRTPQELPEASSGITAEPVPVRRNWLSKLAMVAALLICFAGGMAIGTGNSGTTAGSVAERGSGSVPVVNDVPKLPAVEANRLEQLPQTSESPEQLVVDSGQRTPGSNRMNRAGIGSIGTRASFSGKKKSSLPDLSRAFYRTRMAATESSF